MRMYIAGPVSGIPYHVVEENFRKGAEFIERKGHTAVNPMLVEPGEHFGGCPPGRPGMNGHKDSCNLKADIRELLDCDAIFLMEGWQSSWGVRLELQIATTIGLKVFNSAMEEL